MVNGQVECVHPRRKDYTSRGLEYFLEVSDMLLNSNTTWTLSGNSEVGSTSLDSDFDAVTNRISMGSQTNEFIRLRVRMQ